MERKEKNEGKKAWALRESSRSGRGARHCFLPIRMGSLGIRSAQGTSPRAPAQTAHSGRQSGQHADARRGSTRLFGSVAQRSGVARQAWLRGMMKLEQQPGREFDQRDTFRTEFVLFLGRRTAKFEVSLSVRQGFFNI